MIRQLVLAALAPLCAACSFGSHSLAADPPPLYDLEEPFALREEPRDEAQRAALDPGSFTGIATKDARQSLDALQELPEGILISDVVENSPADEAGLQQGDLLIEAHLDGKTVPLHWPSEWRKLELDTPPGSKVELVLDRAGAEIKAELATARRVRPAPRETAVRYREDQKVGVVVRSATEVEARAAGLGPGGGAVVVGLASGSPWRKDGLVYGDLVTAVRGIPCAHPEVLLEAIRATGKDSTLPLDVLRDGRKIHFEAHVSRRETEVSEISIPLLYSYSNDRGHHETSVLLGIYKHESTKAAWKTRILWFISFSGGDSDRLEQEKS